LKPELWGSPLVQEQYRGEMACDKGQYNNNTIQFQFINEPSQKPDGQLQKQQSTNNNGQ
jgi:hypothetical protein